MLPSLNFGGAMNIVFLLAGAGSRFQGLYDEPKPLIQVGNKTMLEHCVESLNLDGQYIFVTRKYENDKYNKKLTDIILKLNKKSKIIESKILTNGPAASALLAKNLINNDSPLVITNCDQVLYWNSVTFVDYLALNHCDGLVVTYKSQSKGNSYVKVDDKNMALSFAEKKVISEESLNGIHYWRNGHLFIESAEQMIKRNIRVNNEFYISLSYNELLKNNKKVLIYRLAENEHFHIGTPEELNAYLVGGKTS